MYDVDEITEETEALKYGLERSGFFVSSILSRKGVHYIVKPHDPRIDSELIGEENMKKIEVHKDNPTNLYIPSETNK